jgi:peptide/nickel transport system permease protein
VARILIRRIALSIPMLLGMSVIVFAIIRLIPGDPARAVLGLTATPASVARFRAEQHLDDSIVVQYLHWIGNIVTGDFGVDYRSSESIGSLLTDRLPVTIELTVVALGIGVLIGVPIGVVAALRRGRAADGAGRALSLLGICVPDFWVGILAILVFSLGLGLLPASGWVPLSEDPADNLQHVILPALALAAGLAGVLIRITRTAVLGVLDEPFVRALRARGVPEGRIVYRHVLRNAALPIVTVIGMQAGYLLGGALIVEQVFSLPGIGKLAVDSVLGDDYPVVQATVLVIGALYVLVNLVTDVLYVVLNPRLRTGGAG